jgi:hypothetical protein
MPGRSFSSGSYRYGFNKGSEKDNEIAGEGNHYTTFFRELDTRLGRWWKLDQITIHSISPYVSFENNPILYNDPFGDKIKSNRKDPKKSRKQGKDVEIENVKDHEKKLAESLSDKTGLILSFNSNGILEYEKDENGNPIIMEGEFSEEARNDLISGIDDNEFVLNLVLNTDIKIGKKIVNGAISGRSNTNTGFIAIDFADFNFKEARTFDIGMVFFHEYNHSYFGMKDNYTPAIKSGGNLLDLYNGTGYYKLGYPGETVTRVNDYRMQLNLALRMAYEAHDGKVLFSFTTEYLNSKGKLKQRTTYFTLPSY